jgi:hypothetical protein
MTSDLLTVDPAETVVVLVVPAWLPPELQVRFAVDTSITCLENGVGDRLLDLILLTVLYREIAVGTVANMKVRRC